MKPKLKPSNVHPSFPLNEKSSLTYPSLLPHRSGKQRNEGESGKGNGDDRSWAKDTSSPHATLAPLP